MPADATVAPAAALVTTRLSDGRARSQWAYPNFAAVVRASPSVHARAVGRLRFLTSDDQAELYMALASSQLTSGEVWIASWLFPPDRTGSTAGCRAARLELYTSCMAIW